MEEQTKKSESTAKKFFMSLLKALGYFMIYFLIVQGFAFVYSLGYTVLYMASIGTNAILEMSENTILMDTILQDITYRVLSQQGTIMLISGILTLLTLFIIFKVRKKSIKETFSINKIDKKIIIPLILIGVSINIITSTLMAILPFPAELIKEYNQNVMYLLSGNMIINVIAVVIIAPILEEVIFRGLVFTRLKRGMPVVVAVIISTLLYAVMHGQIIWILYTFLIGIVFAVVFIKYKSILANILVHMVYNSVPFIYMIFKGKTVNMQIDLKWIILSVVVFGISTWYLVYIAKKEQKQIKTQDIEN